MMYDTRQSGTPKNEDFRLGGAIKIRRQGLNGINMD